MQIEILMTDADTQLKRHVFSGIDEPPDREKFLAFIVHTNWDLSYIYCAYKLGLTLHLLGERKDKSAFLANLYQIWIIFLMGVT